MRNPLSPLNRPPLELAPSLLVLVVANLLPLYGVLFLRWQVFPVMLLLFACMLWITIVGANYPSSWLSSILLDKFHPILGAAAQSAGFPWWLRGLLVDGMYLATAWVVSVMLPPMAIFFPLTAMMMPYFGKKYPLPLLSMSLSQRYNTCLPIRAFASLLFLGRMFSPFR